MTQRQFASHFATSSAISGYCQSVPLKTLLTDKNGHKRTSVNG